MSPTIRGRESPWEHRAVESWQQLAVATDSPVEQGLEVEVTDCHFWRAEPFAGRPSSPVRGAGDHTVRGVGRVRTGPPVLGRNGAQERCQTRQRREGNGCGDAARLLVREKLRGVSALRE